MLLLKNGQKAFQIAMTRHEKWEFMTHWYGWFYEKSINWSAGLGEEIAYLFGAVINDNTIEVDKESQLFKLLIEHKIPKSNSIWKFIDFPEN